MVVTLRMVGLAALLAGALGPGTHAAVLTGRSEHTVSVGGTTRHFVVRMPEGMPEGPTHVVLVLHGSTRHASADELAPVRFLENEIQAQAAAWSGRGAALVYLAGRDVGSGQFCWGRNPRARAPSSSPAPPRSQRFAPPPLLSSCPLFPPSHPRCWPGAGTDNNLCSAPREGKEDESFLLAVLDWLKAHDSAAFRQGACVCACVLACVRACISRIHGGGMHARAWSGPRASLKWTARM